MACRSLLGTMNLLASRTWPGIGYTWTEVQEFDFCTGTGTNGASGSGSWRSKGSCKGRAALKKGQGVSCVRSSHRPAGQMEP